MATIERTDHRLSVRSGSRTLTLDRQSDKVILQGTKFLFWARKPTERPLSDVVGVNVDANVDRTSGIELCATVLVMRDGSGWAMPYTDRKEATEIATAMRSFLNIAA
jgi:hypothetical protein